LTTISNKPVAAKVVTPKAAPPRFDYGRPTNGGQPVAGKSEGNPPANPTAGPTPGYSISMSGNVDPNPTISGAAIVAPVAQPDATGHPAISAGSKGTVGESGPGLGQ
jgi:hypothetical protein